MSTIRPGGKSIMASLMLASLTALMRLPTTSYSFLTHTGPRKNHIHTKKGPGRRHRQGNGSKADIARGLHWGRI
jgi:hypothetical protein